MSTPFIFFACRRGDTTRCSTPSCGGIAGIPCKFALRGRLAGKTCGRKLCLKCAGEDQLCPSHRRLTAASTAI